MKIKYYNQVTRKIDYRNADTLVTTDWISSGANTSAQNVREATADEKNAICPLLNEYGEYEESVETIKRHWEMR